MYDLQATKSFEIVKTFATIVCVWPHEEKKIGRYKILVYNFCVYFTIISGIITIAPVYLNVYHSRHELIEMLESINFANTGSEALINVIMTRYYRDEIAVRYFDIVIEH